MKRALKLGLATAAIAAGSMAVAAETNSDSPLKAASAKPVTAFDLSTTFGSDKVRVVLTQAAGGNQYSTLINDKLVASATVAAGTSNAAFESYVEASVKAISGVGADPAQFGLASSTQVKGDSGLDSARLNALLKSGAKPAAGTPLTKSAE